MSAQRARHLEPVTSEDEHLVVVDQRTGEARPLSFFQQPLRDELDGAQQEIARLRVKNANLKRDTEARMHEHKLFSSALKAFEHWKIVCHHPNSDFTPDRFKLVQPFLKNTKRFGLPVVLRAIDGAAFQSWVSEYSNGSLKHHNGWKKIFEGIDSVEEHANRSPKGWNLAVSAEMETWKRGVLVKDDWGGLRPPDGWKPRPEGAPAQSELDLNGEETE